MLSIILDLCRIQASKIESVLWVRLRLAETKVEVAYCKTYNCFKVEVKFVRQASCRQFLP